MTSASQDKAAGRVLLPDYVSPTHYDLHLTPNLVAYTFEGIIGVHLTTSADASNHTSIQLHAKELLFQSAKITYNDKDKDVVVEAEEVSYVSLWIESLLETFCF